MLLISSFVRASSQILVSECRSTSQVAFKQREMHDKLRCVKSMVGVQTVISERRREQSANKLKA
uniref:Uncharacterized protein n=1 Tax=Romanomermis culicivorax TaxID=13658 RepID=A0A915L430_ROMCU